ncbi:unnamed protein product [Hanseniaspora opuntiae]
MAKEGHSGKLAKAAKLKNTRTIRTIQHNENKDPKKKNTYNPLLSKDLSLIKTEDYINLKQKEITNFIETIIKNKKYGSNKRAYQSLPRHLRRRTGSHNIRRVPKRLRKRTLKEMMKSDQKVIDGNTGLMKHKKSLTNKQFYKQKMAVKLLKLLTRSKFMKRSIPSKIGKFNVGSRYNLRNRIKVMEKAIKEMKQKLGKVDSVDTLNNKLGHIDLVGENRVVEDTLRLNKSIKYYKRQQGKNQCKWLPSHVYNIKRCHMMSYHGFKVALKPTLKCYRLIQRNNGITNKADKTLVMDTSYLGKLLLTLEQGDDLYQMLSKKFDKNTLKFSNKGVHVDGVYYGCANYLKWIEKKKKLFLMLDSAVYKKVMEKLLMLFKEEIEGGVLSVQDLTFAVGSIKLVGAQSLNTLLKCIRTHKDSVDDDSTLLNFMDVYNLASRFKDYSNFVNESFIVGLNIRDPRLTRVPSLPQIKGEFTDTDMLNLLNKVQNLSKYSMPAEGVDLFDSEKRYESYNDKLTIKDLHKLLNTGNTASCNSKIPLMIFKDNDHIRNSFTIMLPYHWTMPLYYKLNRMPHTFLIGLNQIKQITYDNGVQSLQRNVLTDVTTWQHNYLEYFNALGDREHWLRKSKGRRVNYDKIKCEFADGEKIDEMGDYFKSDWKFLYEYITRDKNIDIVEFIKGYQWKYDNWGKNFRTRFTLFATEEDKILLKCKKIKLVKNGNIKNNARVFRINRGNGSDKPYITDLVGFVSLSNYDLSVGESTGVIYYNMTHNVDNPDEYYEDKFLIKNTGEDVFRLVKVLE